MNDITKVKLIVINELNMEKHKKRDVTGTGAAVYGDKSNSVGSCIVHIEGELDKKLKRLAEGEDIYSIIPDLEYEKNYDMSETIGQSKRRLFEVLDEMNVMDIKKGSGLVAVSDILISVDKIKQGAKIAMGTELQRINEIATDEVIPLLLIVNKKEYLKLNP